MDASIDLDAIRERIRFICAQDQAQWQESWMAVLSAPTSTRRGLVLPDVFLQTLQSNGVFCSRSEARTLVERFQSPNGAVFASKFLQWVALSAPADHMNPELRFPRLPQPYRRIVKVLEEDILDAAWEVITTQSERYRAEVAAGGASTARSSSGSSDQMANIGSEDDFQAAKKRVVKPGRQVPVAAAAHKAPRVVAMQSRVCARFAAAVVSEQSPSDSSDCNARLTLQLVHTSPTSGRPSANSDVGTAFPLEWRTFHEIVPGSLPTGSEAIESEVRVGSVSSLQPLFEPTGELETATSWCMAIRLVQETTIKSTAADPDSPPTTATARCGQVLVLVIDVGGPACTMECQLVAVLNDADPDASATVELSQDARFLSLSSATQGISLFRVPDIDQWRQQSSGVDDPGSDNNGGDDGTELGKAAEEGSVRLISPIDMSSTPRLVLDETTPGSIGDEAKSPPRLHFLVAPVTSRATTTSNKPFASAPITYALVACVDTRVLKFLLLDDPSCQSIAPLIRWEHLDRISASTVEASTDLLVVACVDGSLMVWNVLRDRHRSFMSTRTSTNSPPSVIDAVVYHNGVIVALSTASQQVWFFDTRVRHAPTLLRVVMPPPSSSLSAPQLSTSAATTITALVASTSELGIPVVILQYSTGLALLYDVRTVRAIGSVRTSSPLLSATAHGLCSVGRVMSGHNQLEVIDIYAWEQLVPTGFNDVDDEGRGMGRATQQRVEDDPMTLLYRFAGRSRPPASPVSPKLKTATLPPTPSRTDKPGHKSTGATSLPLQPLIPDWGARFQQLCDEQTDPQAMAERDVALMRRQRAILKAFAATATS